MSKGKINKKNKVIFISLWPITNFSLKRIDIKTYEKNFEIELHDLGLFINPKFSKTYKEENIKSYKIYKFNSYREWLKRILFLKKKYKRQKLLILSEISVNGIKSLICGLTLKVLNCLIIHMEQPGHPINRKEETKTNLYSKKRSKSKEIINSIFNTIKVLHKKLSFFFQTLLRSYFLGNKMYILTVPKRINSCRKLYPFSKIIVGSTYDYNNYLKDKKKSPEIILNTKYALYIDGARPHIQGDEFLFRNKVRINPENWYPKLNNFFDLIESELKLEVVIAGHPKTENTNLEKRFSGRRVIYNKTKDLIKNCEFILTRMSTAISFAVIYKKPIVFVISEELSQEKFFTESQKKYLTSFSQESLFIDGSKTLILKEIKNLKINEDKYKKFLNENLTGSEQTNYFLINEIYKSLVKKKKKYNF